MDQRVLLEQAPAGASGTPAPYGRACIGCAKAKCKCLIRSGSYSCERCVRLGRDCQSQDAIRKRKKKENSLEAKVDGILSLLQSTNEVPNGNPLNNLAFRAAASPFHDDQIVIFQSTLKSQTASHCKQTVMEPISQDSTAFLTGPDSLDTLTPALSEYSSTASDYLRSASYSEIRPSLEEAEVYLADFRIQNLNNFAFIYLSADTTIQQLQQERPFLFLTIMAVSSMTSARKLRLGREIRQILAKELIAENEGSLDVLLGLLVFITWGHDQFIHTHLMSRFMHLAIGMIFDLRLNKPPLKDPYFVLDISTNEDEKAQAHPSTRTMEERRAVLACFVLSSLGSWYFKKIDPLRWTPYMDECLLALTSTPEALTDEIFAHQVQLQLIIQRVSESSNPQRDYSEASRAPLHFYLKVFQSQLLDVQRSLSPAAECNEILQASIHHATISINALALSKGPLITSTSTFTRLDCLSACLTSVNSWFELFFTIPLSQYFNISFPFFAQLAHSIVILHRLSTFEDLAWDQGLVKETLDIMVVLEQLIGNCRLLKGVHSDGMKGELFGKMAMVFEWMRSLLSGKIEKNVEGNGVNGNEMPSGVEEISDVDMMAGMDDTWLSEMLRSWSYDFMSK